MLARELATIESLTAKLHQQNPEISSANVGWHLDHCLRAIIGMSKALQKSDPATYKWRFNLPRLLVLSLNATPRGKGKAPKSVQPRGEVTAAGLQVLLAEAKEQLAGLAGLPSASNFNHPFFGLLNLRQTKRIIQIHTRHHLKIVRDIIA